ncbi:MAG: CDGSH iron-sulfur domain-containing protein [Gemmatimonadales bacterium]
MVEIQISKNGPYHVKGAVEIRDASGNVVESGDEMWLCRCGESANKPFCDGSHKKAGFAD